MIPSYVTATADDGDHGLPNLGMLSALLQSTGAFIMNGAGLRGRAHQNNQGFAASSGARGARSGAQTAAHAHQGGISSRYRQEIDKLVPPKHDPRFVLNHNKRHADGTRKAQTLRKDFSFGIIEPPLDVESFEQDPRIIRGPLPDTSVICAGCDCALVLGGSGPRRIWALPCGHVIDGRCYDRYRHGIGAAKAREMARKEVQQSHEPVKSTVQAGDDIETAEAPSRKTQGPFSAVLSRSTSSQSQSSRGTHSQGTQRLRSAKHALGDSDAEEDSELLRHSEEKMIPLGDADSSLNQSHEAKSLTTASPVRASPPSKRLRQSVRSRMGTYATLGPTEERQMTASQSMSSESLQSARDALANQPSDAATLRADLRDQTRDPTTTNKPVHSRSLVKTFVCPVEGCAQRCFTTAHKAASAIELYI